MADREAVTIDADEARYAALEKEVQAWGDESEEVKQPDPAPTEAANGAEPGKPVDEAKKQQEPQKQERSYEELERNYKNVQGALTESRSEFREMKRQFEAMQEFIRANMAEPLWRQVPRAIGWILDYLFTGTLFKVYRASWQYGLALTYFQGLLLIWIALPLFAGWLVAQGAAWAAAP